MNNQAKLFKTENYFEPFNCDCVLRAKEVFDDYFEKGIILSYDFDHKKWETTNEYANISLFFNIPEFQYRRFYQSIFQLPYKEFIDYLKSFIVFSMKQHVLETLQLFLRDIKRIIKNTTKDTFLDLENISVIFPGLCIDFFSNLPCSDDIQLSQLLEQLDNKLTLNLQKRQKSKQQRQLAQFQSYFTFNDILNDYWSQTLSKKERLFYYPLYLWWQITAILPLRPREFLLIQRNCLTEKDGKYFLTLRRNIIKGRDRLVEHKISEDYTLNTYEITNSLASEIKTYLKLTENDNSTKLDTLFVTDPHYNRWGRRTGVNNRFLTYTNLNTILRYFFNEIISQKYGYQVNYFSFPVRLDENEINLIHIGDTRHIAMINLIAEGASPVTAMLLAGHESVTTSSHYFSNLSQFIECRSYQMYRKLTSKNTNYAISKRQPFYTAQGQYITLENKGRCYSPRFAKGDYSDCLKVISEHAELGACTSCPFYRKAGKDYFSMDKSFKKSVDEKAMVVNEAIRKVRQGKGHIEDIGEALLKLKTVSNTYQDYLNAKQLSLEEKKSNG